MFELNLIKDKALQRQRRRVIFLAIVLVGFLSGLLSIFVGGLIWKEHTKIKGMTAENANLQKQIEGQDAILEAEQPKAEKRRRGLILAYNESEDVRKKRPRFTNILKDLVEQRPRAEFWYNSLTIDHTDKATDSDTNPNAAAESLISKNLRISASGHIQIVDSDVITRIELDGVVKSMQNIERMMGEPKFQVQESGEGQPTTPGEETLKYQTFTLSASKRSFDGGRGIRN